MNEEQTREFVKRSRGKCYLKQIKIGDQYIQKAFCTRCPKCGNFTLGVASDGWEICSKFKCDYEREVFTEEELEKITPVNTRDGVVVYE